MPASDRPDLAAQPPPASALWQLITGFVPKVMDLIMLGRTDLEQFGDQSRGPSGAVALDVRGIAGLVECLRDRDTDDSGVSVSKSTAGPAP